MNVSCPQCKTVFRVDPRKVPAEGTRARCSVCGGVFEVVADEERLRSPGATRVGPAPEPGLSPPATAEPRPAVQPAVGASAQVTSKPPAPALTEAEAAAAAAAAVAGPSDMPRAPAGVEPADVPAAPASAGPAPMPAAPPPVQPAPATPHPSNGEPAAAGAQFGEADLGARARRLARALISDLAVYNPKRQKLGLQEGRLKELFRDDLKKSWEEYVEQVGLETARGTTHFRDALNEILARGKKVF